MLSLFQRQLIFSTTKPEKKEKKVSKFINYLFSTYRISSASGLFGIQLFPQKKSLFERSRATRSNKKSKGTEQQMIGKSPIEVVRIIDRILR